MAGISELSKSILLERGGIFLFKGEYSSSVCKELVRDTIGMKDLGKHMVISIECFFFVEPGTDNTPVASLIATWSVVFFSPNQTNEEASI